MRAVCEAYPQKPKVPWRGRHDHARVLEAKVEFIQKPYTKKALHRRVREVLDQRKVPNYSRTESKTCVTA